MRLLLAGAASSTSAESLLRLPPVHDPVDDLRRQQRQPENAVEVGPVDALGRGELGDAGALPCPNIQCQRCAGERLDERAVDPRPRRWVAPPGMITSAVRRASGNLSRPIVARQVVEDHDVARPQLGDEDLLDIDVEGGAIDRPSSTKGATTPESRRPATIVLVFQCPCGMAARRRAPRGAQPERRAMLVEAQVSSMKTSRSGLRSGCAETRRRAASGRPGGPARPHARSCLARDRMPPEEPPERAVTRRDAVLGQGRSQLFDRCLASPPRSRGSAWHAPRSGPSGGRRRAASDRHAMLKLHRAPADRARRADAEPGRRLAAGQSSGNRCKNPGAKFQRERSRHLCRPLLRQAV